MCDVCSFGPGNLVGTQEDETLWNTGGPGEGVGVRSEVEPKPLKWLVGLISHRWHGPQLVIVTVDWFWSDSGVYPLGFFDLKTHVLGNKNKAWFSTVSVRMNHSLIASYQVFRNRFLNLLDLESPQYFIFCIIPLDCSCAWNSSATGAVFKSGQCQSIIWPGITVAGIHI